MITKYKIFESIYRLPKVKDYVLFPDQYFKQSVDKYLDNLNDKYYIGQIYGKDKSGYWIYNIEPEVPLNAKEDIFINIEKFEKCKYSENKEELEIYQNTKKYNL